MWTTLYGATVTLRPATSDDIPVLAEIRAKTEVYQRWRGGEDLVASVTDDLNDLDEHTLVIEYGGRVVGATGGRGFGTRLYSAIFSVLAFRRITDATNGFRIFRSSLLADPRIDIRQPWLDSYDLEPYVLFKAIRRHRVVEVPCTVVYHAKEGYTKMRGLRDWWRLFRPALLLRSGVRR